MFYKRIFVSLFSIFMILFLSYPATAQFRKVYKFKKVNVPFNMKHEGSIFEKGKYDFEILGHRTLRTFYLKIIKKGKTLCMLHGEILRDRAPAALGEKMTDVPKEPTLKMTRTPAKKIVNIIFETGSLTEVYPCYKLRFQLEYE